MVFQFLNKETRAGQKDQIDQIWIFPKILKDVVTCYHQASLLNKWGQRAIHSAYLTQPSNSQKQQQQKDK